MSAKGENVENIPPSVETFDLPSKGLERDQRQKLSQLQNTDTAKKTFEDSEELNSISVVAREELNSSVVSSPQKDEHFAVVKEVLDEILTSLPIRNSAVVENIAEESKSCNHANSETNNTPERAGCDLFVEELDLQKQDVEKSPNILTSEITVEEQSVTADSPSDAWILNKSIAKSEVNEDDSLVTVDDIASPDFCNENVCPDQPILMPTQVDSNSQQPLDVPEDVLLEASPAHSCKTDTMSDNLSNDKELLDENTNPCENSESDFENNEKTPIIETEAIFSTPKRKIENDSTDNISEENSVPNGELMDIKNSIMDVTTPLSTRKPVIGVASVNRRPAKTETKQVVEDQSPTVQATNLSEAGPQVAEFTEEEFRSCAEVFKDPDSFEFLQKAGSSAALQESALSRLSLYVKFDPLVKARTPVKEQQHKNYNQSTEQHSRYVSESIKITKTETIHEELENEKSAGVVGKLIDYTPDRKDTPRSTRMVSVEPVQKVRFLTTDLPEQKLFTEIDMKKAMQIQDLLYRERILSKEKEILAKEQQIQKMDKKNTEMQSSLRTNRCMMEDVVRLLKNWQGQKEQTQVDVAGRNQKVIKERDQALEDLQNVETAFADLHRRYEKTKGILENMKKNESSLRDQLAESVNKLKKQEQMYEILRSRTEEKLESANTEIETARRVGESEITVLGSQLKKAEMKIGSLERNLEQKNQEYAELSSIYDDLIARVGQRT